jgi:two-component system, OmpR family, sensor histidine kinase KdpD
MSERWRLVHGGGSRARAITISVAAPAAALGLALLIQPQRELGALSLFLLAVVGASVTGGVWAGVGSSLLGFLALNFFFTEPLHTFHVRNRDDVVALVVFLVVALLVGWVVARAVGERDRASRREREARLLHYFATKALSGEPLDRVMDDLAAALVDALRLATCRIEAAAGGRSFSAVRAQPAVIPASPVRISIASGGTTFGTLAAARPSDAEGLSPEDERLLLAAARQIAVLLERAELDAQVADARLEAERSQTRAALFSSVTHDLRTPLASIKAAVTSLLQEDVELDTAQRLELLRTVREETDRLNRLIGNIVDLARVRAGALVPAKEPTALDEVVEAVLHRMEATSGVTVHTNLRDVPEVPVDPVQIDQVLSNLIENAVRFSSPGGEIVVSVAPWHANVQVRVTDHGPGIAPQDRQRVFEPFATGGSMPDARAGSGLGLAIARAIVLAHGGRIWIEGVPGGGTAVVFELPMRDARPVPQETGPREPM